MAKFKMRDRVFNNEIVVCGGYVTNSIFAARKDWFVKNCTCGSTIDNGIKNIEGNAMIKNNGKTDSDYRAFPAKALEEMFKPRFDENVFETKIKIGNMVVFRKENNNLMCIHEFFEDIINSGMEIKAENSRFLFYDRGELVLIISEVDFLGFVKENKASLIKDLQNMVEKFS